MIAHIFANKGGQLCWSGHNARGDAKQHKFAFRVDVGRDFILTSEGRLYLTSPGPAQFHEFSPDGLVVAARSGMFGFKLK